MFSISNISFRYSHQKEFVLKRMSFTFAPGLYGLLGPNGAGKSTLIRLLTASVPCQKGHISWNNRRVGVHSQWFYRTLGYAPQHACFYPEFTGWQMMQYFCELKEIPPKKQKDEILRCSSLFEITDCLNRPVGTYSGGQQQRLMLAQSLLGFPRLIILDEPSAGLDPKEQVRFRKIARAYADDGCVVILSSHVVSDLQNADQVLLINHGEIISADSIDHLCAQYQCSCLEQVYIHIYAEES